MKEQTKDLKTVEAKTNDEKIVIRLYTNYSKNSNNMGEGGIYKGRITIEFVKEVKGRCLVSLLEKYFMQIIHR